MFNMIRQIRFVALGGVALAAVAAQPALAETATGSLSTSATVTSNCIVSTSPVAFGNVDVTTGSAVNGTGGISVTCTNGTAWAADAAAGAGTGVSLTVRKMTAGANLLNYALYTESSRTTLWGDGVTGSKISDTGTGSAQAKTIYGQVLASQVGAPAGSYADTVVVTVTY